jgi:hypothetical protein
MLAHALETGELIMFREVVQEDARNGAMISANRSAIVKRRISSTTTTTFSRASDGKLASFFPSLSSIAAFASSA